MLELFSELAKTPLPTILVVGGLIFLFLSIAGRLGANIAVTPQTRTLSALVGTILLIGGVVLHLSSPANLDVSKAPTVPPQSPQLSPGPVEPSPTPPPETKTEILDISGIWITNSPLRYEFTQKKNSNQITWHLIDTDEEGPAEIKGRDIFATIDQRKVHFFIETIDEYGRPQKITTSDSELVICRQSPCE